MRTFKSAGLRSVILSTLVVLSMAAMALDAQPAQAAPFAYVANGGSVSVIDRSTNKVVAKIPVGPGPSGVALTPNGQFLYVTNSGSNTVSVIATASNMVVKTITVGRAPQDVAITPNGNFAYVTNQSSNNISVVATASNMVIQTIPLGISPINAAITPNGKFVYLSGSGTVYVIATANNTVVKKIPLDAAVGGTFGVGVTPNGDSVYVGADRIFVIATANNAVVDTTVPFDGLVNDVAFTPDGRIAYIAVGEAINSVVVMYTANNALVQQIRLPGSPQSVAVSPYGKFLYVTQDNGTVAVFNSLNNQFVGNTIGTFNSPQGVAIGLPGVAQRVK